MDFKTKNTIFYLYLLTLILKPGTSNDSDLVDERPVLHCPEPIEEGTNEISIECTVNEPKLDFRIAIAIPRSGRNLIDCTRQGCSANYERYTGVTNIDKRIITTSLHITQVTLTDEVKLVCILQKKRMSEVCQIQVYVVPEKPLCSTSFDTRSALVTCTTYKVYPKAVCRWKYSTLQNMSPSETSNHTFRRTGYHYYYSSTCSTRLPIFTEGNYIVELQMFPGYFNETSHSFNSVVWTERVDVNVVPPVELLLSVSKGDLTESELIVEEYDDITITCSSVGGNPQESYMTLECGNKGPGDLYGQKISMKVIITRSMAENICSCSAKHISQQTIYSRARTIYVTATPRLTLSTQGNGKIIGSELIVKNNEKVVLTCNANGGIPSTSFMRLECFNGQYSNTSHRDSIQLYIVFKRDMEERQCTCITVHNSKDIEKSLTIKIVVTPNIPQLYVDTGIATRSELIVKAYGRAKLTCTSNGGTPAVSDLKITCPYDTRVNDFYTSTAIYSIYFSRYMHGKQCICSVGHVSLQDRLNTSLIIIVVVVPETPICEQVFNTTSVQVSCSTTKVFPQANCKWRSTHQIYSSKLDVAEKLQQYGSHKQQIEEYYTTTCSTSLALDYPSSLRISIDMYPDLHEFNVDMGFATVTVTVDILAGSAKITSFTVEGSKTNQVEVNAGSHTLMLCQAAGNPRPSMRIESTNIYGENDVIKQEDDYSLNHKMFLSCNKTGTYTCAVNNIFNSQSDVQKINLKIKCKAEYYKAHDTEPNFGVPVNRDFNITLHILVYPMPTKFDLYKGSSQVFPTEPARFSYTNERFSLGEIYILMKLLSPSDYGLYSLKVMNRQTSTLRFKLSARGPPLCPTDFIVQNISTNMLTLSWRPGFDGGLNQTFAVISHSLAKNLTESHPVGETSNDVMVHNVTGLSDGTLYVLTIETENSEGKRRCPHVSINVTTFPDMTSMSPALIAIATSSMAGFFAVLTLGIIAVILMRKRRCHQPVSLDFDRAFSSRITLEQQREHTVQNQLYNGISGSIAEEVSTLNSGGVSTFKSLSTNAPGNPYHFKIESAAIGEIYANVVKIESDAAQNVNNSAGVYNNTKSLKASGNDVKKSNIIAAMKHSKPRGQDGVDESGRTVSADGLTYVSVVVKPKDRKMKFGEGEEDTVRGPIDYAAIDLAATSEANREKMAKK